MPEPFAQLFDLLAVQGRLDALFALLERERGEPLRQVLMRFCRDYEGSRYGYPDLLVLDDAGGTPSLTLETGDTDRTAVFQGLTGNVMSFRYTVEEGDTDKIVDPARILARYAAAPMNLHLVPVVPYEMRAIGNVPDSFDMVMFRRFMVKTAAWLARRWDDPAFPRAFPWFNTPRYWSDHILELREQFAELAGRFDGQTVDVIINGLQLDKVASADTVYAGDTVTYTVSADEIGRASCRERV